MIDHNLPFEGLKDNWRIVRKKEEGTALPKTDEETNIPKSKINIIELFCDQFVYERFTQM